MNKSDKVSIWSDMDISFKGNMALEFKLQVFKDNEQIGVYKFDPTKKNITIGEVKTVIMDKTNWRFTGKK